MRIFLAGVRKSSTLLRPVYEGICRRNGIGVHQIPGAGEVTLIQMSFAKSEIWIALPGDGATFLEAN
jgi:hypothetical protein